MGWDFLRSVSFNLIVSTIVILLSAYVKCEDPQDSQHLYKLYPSLTHDDEQLLFFERQTICRVQEDLDKHIARDRECTAFNRNNLKFFFSLFAIIAWGAIVRIALRFFKLTIPYTVVLIITGLCVGMGTRITDSFCVEYSMYTKIARTPPKVILLVFLPVLIFESSFGMKAHIFYRSFVSILILALPGMLLTTFLTAAICQYFLFAYKWSFVVAALFGSIISATDPVAVVAILKEIGTSETLSIIIDGESLLNDGVAILLYEIFVDIVKEPEPEGNQGLHIFMKFAQITLGGPVWGYITAKMSTFFLRRIFNDPAVEVTITLTAAYLTYYIAEEFLQVSGVMAVVILGVILSSERTCISPEVQGLVHHFWEMLGYLANTVLFVLVGIVISETAINNFTKEDGYYLIFLYIMLNIVRLLMILLASPILGRIGYSLSWQNMVVVAWGGLRGAVGICLALQVFKDKDLCQSINIGPKFLIQTAGIVILTLLINGTTTKAMLDMLKLTELSVGKIQDMTNAVKQVELAQSRSLAMLRHDRFLADANWDLVQDYTKIKNPYEKSKVRKSPKANQKSGRIPSLLTLNENVERIAVCPNCDEQVKSEPSADDYRIMTEEARLRLIKALKVSCWRQYEQGILTEEAIQILISALETTEDKELSLLHCSDIEKHWQVKGFIPWIRDKLNKTHVRKADRKVLVPPNASWRLPFYKMTTSTWFEVVINVIIILNMFPVIYETVLIFKDNITSDQIVAFFWTNIVFTSIYLFEFIFKIIGLGAKNFWSEKWNYIDLFVLVISIVEISLSITYLQDVIRHHDDKNKLVVNDAELLKFLRFIRLARIARIIRLFKPVIPKILNNLDSRINYQLFLGFDVGKGFVLAADDVIKFLPQMVEHPRVLTKLKFVMHEERLATIRSLGILKKKTPGIAIAVKTRHTSRSILNHMRESLYELKEDGLLDEKEFELVVHALEERMKRLWESPSFIAPVPAHVILKNIAWVSGHEELSTYIHDNATLLSFSVEDIICDNLDPPNGVYIIVSGVIKCHYEPTIEIVTESDELGRIPVMEMFDDLSYDFENYDYFSTGNVIGELSVLTGRVRNSKISCETDAMVYHISQSAMEKALEAFNDPYDSLESRIWRSLGIRLTTSIMQQSPSFSSWSLEKMKAHIERSAVPPGESKLVMTIPDFIDFVVVIYGQVVNSSNEEEVFTAPTIIPHTVTKITNAKNSDIIARLLVIAKEDVEPDLTQFDDKASLHKLIQAANMMHRHSLHRAKKANHEEDDNATRMKRFSMAVNFGVQSKSKKNLDNLEIQESSLYVTKRKKGDKAV